MLSALDRSRKLYVAGHRGLVGSAIWRVAQDEGFTDLVGRTSTELDLRDRDATFEFFAAERPYYVVMAAARVGGIMANSTYPAEFISDNLRVQVNVLDAAHEAGVDRLLFLGSSCIYPKLAEQPIREDSLMTGPLEPTNDAYAIAKIAGILQVQALRREYGVAYISAMPTNLYGPNDNFDPTNSHVIPALMRRIHEAARSGEPTSRSGAPGAHGASSCTSTTWRGPVCSCWRTTTTARRSTSAPVPTCRSPSWPSWSRRSSATTGQIVYDASKPDGTPRKLLDVSRIAELGWKAQVDLRSGLQSTYEWFCSAHDLRGLGA